MKDDINCHYNGGGDTYLLQSLAIHFNLTVIPGLHTNIFSVIQALQKGFKGTSEYETLILKKNSTDIHFGEKMANNRGEVFLLTTNFYKSANDSAFLAP